MGMVTCPNARAKHLISLLSGRRKPHQLYHSSGKFSLFSHLGSLRQQIFEGRSLKLHLVARESLFYYYVYFDKMQLLKHRKVFNKSFCYHSEYI